MLALAFPESLCLSPRHANTGAFSSARGCPCWRRPPRKAFVFRHANRARIFCVGGRPCWRRAPRKALRLRLATPTGPEFSAPAVAHVGVGLPAKPLSFATPRQHRRLFLGARAPMLASATPQSLCPSSRHANRARIFCAGGRPCWRWPSRKAFVFRHATPTPALFPRRAAAHVGVGLPGKPLSFATPTGPGFSASAGAHVGVGLPAKPYAFVSPRQQGLSFPRRRWPMLALASPQSLCPSPRHANTGAFSSARGRPCWRRPPRKAFVLRLATPTGPGFSAPAAAHVGVGLPGKPLPFISPRQHRRLYPSPRHANRTRALPANRACPPRARFPCRPALYPVLYRIICCI